MSWIEFGDNRIFEQTNLFSHILDEKKLFQNTEKNISISGEDSLSALAEFKASTESIPYILR